MGGDGLADPRHLRRARGPQKTQMRAGHDQPAALGKDRAPRLQPRQVQPVERLCLDAPLHQHGVAVPAKADVAAGMVDDPVVGLVQDHLGRQGRGALAQPQVHLLKDNHVAVDLPQDPQDAVRVAPPVEPDRLVDVVTDQTHGTTYRIGARRRANGAP